MIRVGCGSGCGQSLLRARAALRGHHAGACTPEVMRGAVDDFELLANPAHRARDNMAVDRSVPMNRREHRPSVLGDETGQGVSISSGTLLAVISARARRMRT